MLDIVKIAICDDEDMCLKELSDDLNQYANEHRVDMGIYTFKNGPSLLEELRKLKQNDIPIFDIIILDYEMDNMNGIELAKTIRELGYESEIVFLSKFEYFFRETYKVKTSRFLKKPIKKEELYEYLNSYIKAYRGNAPIIVEENGELIRIKSSNIIYLSADRYRCRIHLEDRIIHSWKRLGIILKLMPQPYFYRVHHSFAINMNHVKYTDNNEVILSNGKGVPITKTKIAKFKKDYIIFSKNFRFIK